MQFQDLNLIPALCANVKKEGYETPTPVQAEAIPAVLAGRDLLACAQTGTGKTAAFALPILQALSQKKPVNLPCGAHTLILTPTRELAEQIGESFITYGRGLNLKTAIIYGGVGYVPQKDALRRGVDVLVATPGRLLDLLGQRSVMLTRTAVFVLDEADRMLDMGFINDVRKISDLLPKQRQTLLFSATMPAEIRSLAEKLLVNPHQVQVATQSATADNIDQSVYFVSRNDKPALLRHILTLDAADRVLVFTRTKHGADKVARRLCQSGIDAESIHGNKSQNARRRSLERFKEGGARVLVATDIASRGIDIDSISHVVNYELPDVPETYVHRIGRTARAGASGVSVSFCDNEERSCLRDIERLIRTRIKVMETPDIAISDEDREMERKAAADYGRTRERSDNRYGRDFGNRRDRGDRNDRPRRPAARPPARPAAARPAPRPFFERFIPHRPSDRPNDRPSRTNDRSYQSSDRPYQGNDRPNRSPAGGSQTGQRTGGQQSGDARRSRPRRRNRY